MARLELEQAIHNLLMRIPIGIKSIDDAHDAKLKRLQALAQGDSDDYENHPDDWFGQ